MYLDKIGFLNRAEAYAESRGDAERFKTHYTRFRECHNIEVSVWSALTWLYDKDTAKLLKYQYWGPTL